MQEQLEPVRRAGHGRVRAAAGHRYATVILEPHTRRVLWVEHDRSRVSILPFFEVLGEAGCRAIQAVTMDMSAGYALEVKTHCPQARIVYDLFHVVAKYGHDVIDRVRVDEANRLREEKRARKVIKTARRLEPSQRHHRQRLMAAQHQRP